MAARPLQEEVIALIDARGGLEPIYARLADGESVKSIAASYTPEWRKEKPLSRPWFYFLLTRTPELKEAYLKAMEVKADTLVEEAGEILDTVPVDRDEIQKADKRAQFRVWLASRLNRKTYGEPDKQPVNVQINVETMHLDALRKSPANVPALPVSGTALLPVKDAEIITETAHGSEDHAPAIAGGQ